MRRVSPTPPSAPPPSAGPEPDASLSRLDAVCDLLSADVRESAGLHRYDGVLQDLSDDAVAAGLARLGQGPAPADPHDAAHLGAFEQGLRWSLGEQRQHHANPLLHINNLDLACYDREYAPAADRARARAQHLAGWPAAVDVAVRTLDEVPAPVATALLPAARGLAAGLAPDEHTPAEVVQAALAAHARLLAHLQQAAADGPPETAVGPDVLARELGVWEATEVDLPALAATAVSERDRLTELLAQACSRLDPQATVGELVPRLLADHPDAEGVLVQARQVTAEVLAFTAEHSLAPADGQCLVGPAPESRGWAMAMMSWSAPEEPDAASWYHVTPPGADWPEHEQEEWLSVFSATSLPAITVHEVAPGHYSHGRALRRAPSPVRRRLMSATFAEGWAHYVEEAVIEEGFRAHDPRYVIGMCLEALVRVTRLAASIGLHAEGWSVEQAAQRFAADAHLGGSAARSEAARGTFDVGYGRYTWGKLALQDLRAQARTRWGTGYDVRRFHRALLELGSPPIGLLGTALDRG